MKVIRIPNGQQVTLGQYVRTWKELLAMPTTQEVRDWQWFSVTAGEVLRDISEGVQDRINRRGGITLRTATNNRLRRLLIMHIKCECRWCGQPLASYAAPHERFCTSSCKRDFYS